MMLKSILMWSLILFANSSYALDLEDSAKDYEKSEQWASFSLTDMMGRLIVTRAGTEDARSGASLALTYPTIEGCKLSEALIVIPIGRPDESSNSFLITGTVQIDSKPVRYTEAQLVREIGSEFLFISMDYKDLDKKLLSGKVLTVNYKGYGVLEFSLNGARKSIETAHNRCLNHVAH